MSGPVTLAVLFPDGSRTVVCPTAASVVDMVNDLQFSTQPVEHLSKYLQKVDSTPIPFVPSGYGLIVVDLKNMVFYHQQNYGNFGDGFYLSTLILEANISHWGPPQALPRLKAFWDAGRAGPIEVGPGKTFPFPSWDEFQAWLIQQWTTRDAFGYVRVDQSPMTFRSYGHSSLRGIKDFRKELVSAGVQFTQAETREWVAQMASFRFMY